jgi:hypothetical protein
MTAFTLVEAVIVLIRVRYEGKAFFHYRKDVFFFTQNAQNYMKREATQNHEPRSPWRGSILRILRVLRETFRDLLLRVFVFENLQIVTNSPKGHDDLTETKSAGCL